MVTFSRFEDINAWQKARTLANAVYRASDGGKFSRDFSFRDQIRRSALSVMANIAEGQGRKSDKEFANFLNIAIGSVAETKSHLYVAHDLEYIGESDFAHLYGLSDEVGRMLTSLAKFLINKTRPPS